MTLPFDSPAFADAWSDWKQHRKEIKKPITPTSEKQQLQTLAEMGESMAIETIRHTINRGWQGLRPPDNAQSPITATPDTLQSIQSRIMATSQGWALPLATNETKAICERLAIFESLTADQWDAIRRYLAAKLPEGQPGWQPRGRLKFIETITDVWSYAEQWDRKHNGRRAQTELI